MATADEILARLGRTQAAYKEYGTAGRQDLQQGASKEGDKIRKEAAAAGIKLDQFGTANPYGRDYTSYYTGTGPAGAYDPTKAGLVQRVVDTGPATDTGGGATTNPSSDLITRIYDGNLSSQLQGLHKVRDTALQGLTGIETQAKQGAFANRNAADVTNAQNAQRLREMMAANGLTASGDNITATTNLAGQRQGAINDINQGEQNTLTDVGERRTLINNNAAGDEQALMQQLAAARDNMLLNQFNADRQFGLQEGGLTGSYNGQRTLQGQQFDFAKSTDERNFGYTQARDAILDKRYQTQFEEDTRRFGLTYALQKAQLNHQISNDAAQRSISWYNANTSRQNADWAQSDQNPDNMPKNNYQGLSPDQILSSARSMYSEPYYGPSDLLGKPGPKLGDRITTDQPKREQMFLQVIDSGLPTDAETYQVLYTLGMTKDEIDRYKKKYSR